MIQYNQDGSGIITAENGSVATFSAGITPSDLLAMQTALQPVVSAPPIVNVAVPPQTINVSAVVPDITSTLANVTQIFGYLPKLVSAVSGIPGAVSIPPAPVPTAAVVSAT